MNKTIDIVLTAYNNELYIKELLDSILDQTWKDWKLILRDDCSSDKTVDIIKEYVNKYPQKLTFLEEKENKRLGPKFGFEYLMKQSNSNYIMFADADDYWLPNKVEITFAKMMKLENEYPNLPILVFTDLVVVNERLNTIHPSFWKYSRIDPLKSNDYHQLILNNCVTGCTVMINKSVKEVSLPIPKEAIMHDHWLAINTAKFGKIGFVDETTILYRQHQNNDTGAENASLKYYLLKVLRLKKTVQTNMRVIKMSKKLPFRVNYIYLIYLKTVQVLLNFFK